MRILVAPDSFKDALSAKDAAHALETGLRRVSPDISVLRCPLGDGGEGTLNALISALGASVREEAVTGPLGKPKWATWGWVASEKLAIIELAEASGLQHLALDERSAMHTTTFGTGELLLRALDAGAQRIILNLGGSATNDAGAGILQALGARLLDRNGSDLPFGGSSLRELEALDMVGLDPRLEGVAFEIAADVDNPLCGPCGASHVFGPQKGASPEEVAILDASLANFASLTASILHQDFAGRPGAGAAGGVGFAALAFLNAKMRSGIEIVMDLVGFKELLQQSDLVITGEGGVDGQSLAGKTPIGVARAARQIGVPVVLLAGHFGPGWQEIYDEGVTAAFPLTDAAMPLAEALARTPEFLRDRGEAVGRLWLALVQIGSDPEGDVPTKQAGPKRRHCS